MLIIVGLIVVFIMVFGGYIIAGGKFGIILKALPFEMMIIGGGAAGAYVVSNGKVVLKATGGAFKRGFKGPYWQKQDFMDLVSLMFFVIKTAKSKGLIPLEPHLDRPDESTIFSHYSRIAHDHFSIDFICDTLRMVSMNMEDPHQVEDFMEKLLEKHHHEIDSSPSALQTMADGLPAIGIVAAVLGVIKTMASIDQPPEILGKMIGGALVGTFLGVFLAYCVVGPIANTIKQTDSQDHQFYLIIRDMITAYLQGQAPQVCAEIGRSSIPTHIQPSFVEMEEFLNNIDIKLE